MPRYIVKFTDSKTQKDYYLEWSSIVDAPVTYGVSLDEFKDYYLQKYGSSSSQELQERLVRVQETGTSDMLDRSPVEKWTAFNRAGKDERKLSYKQLIRQYCLRYPQ